jgi:hypothetical protein
MRADGFAPTARFAEMLIIRCATSILVAVAVASCAGNAVIQERTSEDAQAGLAMKASMASAKERCDAEFGSPALDPIRAKVQFDPSTPTPMALLILTTKPNSTEKKALLAWSLMREKCSGYLRAAIADLPLPPAMDPAIKDQAKAGLTDYVNRQLQGGNYLTAMLYTGQLTFGEFSKRRAEFHAKLHAQMGAWLAVLDARDKASTMQKAAAAQQEADAAVAILQAAACAGSRGRASLVLCQ